MMKKIIKFFKNYWYYYKTPAIIVAFILLLTGVFVCERLSFVKPDMIIDCISDNLYLSPENIDAICEDIENSGSLKDIDEDEKVKVSLSPYSAGAADTTVGTGGGSAYELMGLRMAVGESAIIIADKKVIEKYEVYGIFKDLSEMADRLSIPEEDRIYYKDGTLVGIRIDNRGIIKRLGIPGKDVFLTLRIPTESTDEEMVEQAPNVAEYMLK